MYNIDKVECVQFMQYTYIIHVTVNARWQSRCSRSRAAVHVPNFYSSVAGTRAIEIRYVNDSSGAGTTALSPGVHRHICLTLCEFFQSGRGGGVKNSTEGIFLWNVPFYSFSKRPLTFLLIYLSYMLSVNYIFLSITGGLHIVPEDSFYAVAIFKLSIS